MHNSKGHYMAKREQFANASPSKPDAAGIFITEFLQEFIVVSALGFWRFIKVVFSIHFYLPVATLGLFAWSSGYITSKALHIKLIHDLAPEILTYKRLEFFYEIPFEVHRWTLTALFLFPVLIILGFIDRYNRTKYDKLFRMAGLTNGLGDTPKLVRQKKIDSARKQVIFDSAGIGISEFQAKQERFEAHFKTNIESIKVADHPGQIVLTLNDQKFPEKVTYQEALGQCILPQESFYIGHTVDGIKAQKIADLPHLLIAGATNSGKSVFFKQALLGLLESSPHLQMYLIDLKGGLEMVDFVDAPNVKVVKTIQDALSLLRKVEREMKRRFDYLEKAGRKQINPATDKIERLVVAVDEASVLYMKRPKGDPDYNDAMEARKLADSIAKLSRAAAIHLLLATQKLDREVIPTSVSENISGRMAFKANSLQGSLVVLGTKDALELPEIPGRGIWSFGTKKMIVQAPYVDEKTIKSRCLAIKEDFEVGRRSLFTSLIEMNNQEEEQKVQSVLSKNVKPRNSETTEEQK